MWSVLTWGIDQNLGIITQLKLYGSSLEICGKFTIIPEFRINEQMLAISVALTFRGE